MPTRPPDDVTERAPVGDAGASAVDDPAAVARFVERFGLLLTEAGWPRTPARLFACLLTDHDGRLTAHDLAARLVLSPAAVSGGVRYLVQLGLVRREREPGARRDHYRVVDDVWTDTFLQRVDQLRRWEEGLAEGVAVVGADSPAGRRLEESRSFFRFMQDELPAMIERWRHQRAGEVS